MSNLFSISHGVNLFSFATCFSFIVFCSLWHHDPFNPASVIVNSAVWFSFCKWSEINQQRKLFFPKSLSSYELSFMFLFSCEEIRTKFITCLALLTRTACLTLGVILFSPSRIGRLSSNLVLGTLNHERPREGLVPFTASCTILLVI